jgi:hypothetical protein
MTFIFCADCLFSKHITKDKTCLCTVHEQIKLPAYIEPETHRVNIVNTTDSCGLARAKLKPEFIL